MAAQTLSVDDDGVMAEINMTPLVDVMLVLLIIFMITMPVITRQIPVQLPPAGAAEVLPESAMLTITVQADGQVLLDQQPKALTDLEQVLRDAASVNPDRPVHLAADTEVAYGKVMAVMDVIRSAGLTNLGFMTRPSDHQ